MSKTKKEDNDQIWNGSTWVNHDPAKIKEQNEKAEKLAKAQAALDKAQADIDELTGVTAERERQKIVDQMKLTIKDLQDKIASLS